MNFKLNQFLKTFTPRLNALLTISFVLFWAADIGFVGIAEEILEGEPLPFDIAVLNAFHSIANSTLDQAVILLTQLGGVVFIAGVTILLTTYFIIKQKRRSAGIILFTAGGAALMNLVLKLIFQRERPSLWQTLTVENSFSFPSGHAMASSALAFSLMVIFWNTKWRWLVVGMGSLYILIVGSSRVYLGVHFPSDVLAGWSVSLAWALLVAKIFMFDQVKSNSKK